MGKRRAGRPRHANQSRPAASSKPHYQRVVEGLRRQILDGTLPKYSCLPPMRRLAKEYGVSFATVNYAMDVLKSEHLVAPNLRRRLVVRARTGALLTPDNTILQVVPNKLDLIRRSAEFRRMQNIIENDVGRIHSSLWIANDSLFRTHFPQAFLDRPLRGIVVVGPISQPLLKKYGKVDIPCVLVDQAASGAGLHSVSVANEDSARDAVERLAALGHRRIALLRRVLSSQREVDPDSKERTAGFRKGMKAAGKAVQRDDVFNFLSFDQAESPALQGILKARPAFTAVLCVDGTCAKNLLLAARPFGIRVPQDLSILAFGSIEESGLPFSGPRIDFSNLASRVVPLLLEPRRPAQQIRVPTVWHEGQTLGPPGAGRGR